MEVAEIIAIIDALVKVTTVGINAIGGQQGISDIIAARIAAGRSTWTDDEKKQVQDAMDSARQYALDQAGLPDAP